MIAQVQRTAGMLMQGGKTFADVGNELQRRERQG